MVRLCPASVGIRAVSNDEAEDFDPERDWKEVSSFANNIFEAFRGGSLQEGRGNFMADIAQDVLPDCPALKHFIWIGASF
jgi:hypothetical protein